MKHPTGSVRPRRLAVPRTPKPAKKVRLDLKRRPVPEPERDLDVEKKSSFWKWVLFVALLHILVIGIACFIYQMTPAPKPPEQYISLLPEGDIVKGTAGAQEAHKIGPTTSAPAHHHTASASKPPTAAKPPTPITPPPKPKLILPPPTIEPPSQLTPATLTTTPPKPTPPKPPKPKVKVDLTLADAPDADKPVTKPKPHKKPSVKPTEDSHDDDAADSPDSAGLSKEQIAEKLGEKADEAGVKSATNTGTSGAANARPNNFADFYASIRDQVMSQWQSPNLSDETAVNPIVQIHVENDGRVPPEDVHLIQSSGNPTYDDSAVSAAKNLGYLHEPLPQGCPPDIPITFKLTR
jgi:TonB family protein